MEGDMAVYGYARMSTDGQFLFRPISRTQSRELHQDISRKRSVVFGPIASS